ncbi:MAG: superoxide dismutase [Armatimonadetes bacterium]|nr:superoxide dismutase [Armatimonadota bacterium]
MLDAAKRDAEGKLEYTLPPLPYAYDALEPVISKTQLELHHDKHHVAYVAGLNKTLAAIDAAARAGDTAAVKALSADLAFHYGGHVLHTLYWPSLKPGGSAPTDNLAAMIERDFGSLENLKKWLSAAAVAVAGSGWAVLAYEPVGQRLVVMQTEIHNNLVGWGMVPLLPVDVWEHAYYLDYQNRRADYVAKLMDIVDWQAVGARLAAAQK